MKETKFKQTEVGMIPCDWEVKRLSDFAATSSGGTPSRSISDYYNGDIKWFTTTELKDCFLNDSIEHISEDAINNSSAKIFPKNTLLMAMYGATIGRLGILNFPAATNQACCAIFPKNNDVQYLYYFFLHNRDNIVAMGCGAGQPNISQEIVKKILVPLPPTIEEQKRIAQALSDVDAVISTTEKLIAKKKALKQGAMQTLLSGKMRIPLDQTKEKVTEPAEVTKYNSRRHCEERSDAAIHNGFKMTELGLIPEDWQVKRLGDEVILSTETFESAQYKKEFYVGTENMLQDKAGITKNETVNPIGKAKGFKRNDILMSNIRPYLKKIWYANRDGICSNDVLVYRVAKNAIDSSFLYSILSDDKFFAYVMENAVGTKMPRGDKKIIREYLFACPPTKEEQTAIATVLGDMDSEIAALETKLAKYRQLKTGMMQQLLTGKIRLIK